MSAAHRKTAELAGECVKWKNKFTAASSDCQKEKQVCVHTEMLRESGTDGTTGTHTETTHLPRPENSVVQSSSLKIAQLASQCCSRGQVGCSTATVPGSVHFTVACVVYYLNDPVSASCEVFVVSLVVASRLATAFLTGN